MADPVTSDPIRAAIEQLRAEYAEIPEWQRAQRWHASDLGTDSEHWWLEAGEMSIANFGQGVQSQIDAERAARMCAPLVTEALIEQLDAIDETLTFYSTGLGEEITVEVEQLTEPQGWSTAVVDELEARMRPLGVIWSAPPEGTEHFRAYAARLGAMLGANPVLAPTPFASIMRAIVEAERGAEAFAAQLRGALEPGFRALRLALGRPIRPKVARRLRRAELRRVHRDYVIGQRHRRRSHLGYGVVTVSLPIYDEAATLPTHDTEAR